MTVLKPRTTSSRTPNLMSPWHSRALPDQGKDARSPPAHKATSPANNAQAKPGPSSTPSIQLTDITALGPPNTSLVSSLRRSARCFYMYLCPSVGRNKMQGAARSQTGARGAHSLSRRTATRAANTTSQPARLPPCAPPPRSSGLLPARSPQLPITNAKMRSFGGIEKRHRSISLYAYVFGVCACMYD